MMDGPKTLECFHVNEANVCCSNNGPLSRAISCVRLRLLVRSARCLAVLPTRLNYINRNILQVEARAQSDILCVSTVGLQQWKHTESSGKKAVRGSVCGTLTQCFERRCGYN